MPISECPNCGSKYGYYRITYMKGRGQTNYEFENDCHKSSFKKGGLDGIDNSTLHDCLTYKENKTAFCIDCDSPINMLKSDNKSKTKVE